MPLAVAVRAFPGSREKTTGAGVGATDAAAGCTLCGATVARAFGGDPVGPPAASLACRPTPGLSGLLPVVAAGRGAGATGLSAARVAFGREAGAERSPPSGGKSEPVTAAHPLFDKPHDQLCNDTKPDGNECSEFLTNARRLCCFCP